MKIFDLNENTKWIYTFVVGTLLAASMSVYNIIDKKKERIAKQSITISEYTEQAFDLLGLKPTNPYAYEWKYYRGDPFGESQKQKLEEARRLIEKIKITIADIAIVEQEPKMLGSKLFMLMAPKK